ncbi:hypothetical protein HK102_006615 [Quaeritorhiza haematococci]|nr:hypothetical protein HK102_006615 [Quaeritorhiza haematococci]
MAAGSNSGLPVVLDQLVPPCQPGLAHLAYGCYHLFQVDLNRNEPRLMSSTSGTSSSTVQNKSGILAAVIAGDADLVKELLELKKGASKDSTQDQGHNNTLQSQEQGDASDDTPQTSDNDDSPHVWVNLTTSATGLVPLHYAASKGYLDVVQVLVESAGALVDLPDPEGETSLLKAAYNGHVEVIQYLLSHSANVHHRCRDGWTALHNCGSRGHTAAAQCLIANGANVNTQSNTGHTPLMLAASKGYLDIVEILLQHEANPLVKNKFNDTAYDLAAQSEEGYICEILENAEESWQEKSGQTYKNIHNTVLEVIHENQRSGFLSSRFSAANLGKQDVRGPWSDKKGRPTNRENVQLPLIQVPASSSSLPTRETSLIRGWFWLTDWKVDTKHPRIDPEGWQYARSLEDPENAWAAAPTGTVLGGWVRRRRWIRVRKKRLDLDDDHEKGGDTSIDETQDNQDENEGSDYIERAQALVGNSHGMQVDLAFLDRDTLQEEARMYEEAIQILLVGLKTDQQTDRKKKASPMIQAFLDHAELIQVALDSGATATEDASRRISSANRKGKGRADDPTSPAHHNDFASGASSHAPHHQEDHQLSAKSIPIPFSQQQTTPTLSARSTPETVIMPRMSGDQASPPSAFGSVPNDSVVSSRTADQPLSSSMPTSLQSTGLWDRSASASITPSDQLAHTPRPSSPAVSVTPPSTWQPDEEAPECQQCKRKFTLWVRRHHCRCTSFLTGPNSPLPHLKNTHPDTGDLLSDLLSARILSTSAPSSLPPGITTSAAANINPSPASSYFREISPVLSSRRVSLSSTTSSTADGRSPSSVRPPMDEQSMTESVMNECPVCQQPLSQASEEEAESHVADCLQRVALGGGKGQIISGNRYVGELAK